MAHGAVAGRRKTIGEDIATLEFCWPVGMPRCSSIKGIKGLYEIRSNISSGRIARVFFALIGNQMVLLHGFIKKNAKDTGQGTQSGGNPHEEVQRYED